MTENYLSPAVIAIAKQIATFNGQIFEKLGPTGKGRLLALANSILATAKRLEKAR
jgi:hypothetical protein